MADGIYDYDETAPITRPRNDVLQYQRPDQEPAAYLVELPGTLPLAPPEVQARDERRGTSILHMDQSPARGQEEDEPLESYIRANLSTFRKSLTPEDLNEGRRSVRRTEDKERVMVEPDTEGNRTRKRDCEGGQCTGEENENPKKGIEYGQFNNTIIAMPMMSEKVGIIHEDNQDTPPSSRVKVLLMADVLDDDKSESLSSDDQKRKGKMDTDEIPRLNENYYDSAKERSRSNKRGKGGERENYGGDRGKSPKQTSWSNSPRQDSDGRQDREDSPISNDSYYDNDKKHSPLNKRGQEGARGKYQGDKGRSQNSRSASPKQHYNDRYNKEDTPKLSDNYYDSAKTRSRSPKSEEEGARRRYDVDKGKPPKHLSLSANPTQDSDNRYNRGEKRTYNDVKDNAKTRSRQNKRDQEGARGEYGGGKGKSPKRLSRSANSRQDSDDSYYPSQGEKYNTNGKGKYANDKKTTGDTTRHYPTSDSSRGRGANKGYDTGPSKGNYRDKSSRKNPFKKDGTLKCDIPDCLCPCHPYDKGRGKQPRGSGLDDGRKEKGRPDGHKLSSDIRGDGGRTPSKKAIGAPDKSGKRSLFQDDKSLSDDTSDGYGEPMRRKEKDDSTESKNKGKESLFDEEQLDSEGRPKGEKDKYDPRRPKDKKGKDGRKRENGIDGKKREKGKDGKKQDKGKDGIVKKKKPKDTRGKRRPYDDESSSDEESSLDEESSTDEDRRPERMADRFDKDRKRDPASDGLSDDDEKPGKINRRSPDGDLSGVPKPSGLKPGERYPPRRDSAPGDAGGPGYEEDGKKKFLTVRTPKSATTMLTRKRYHVKIPDHSLKEPWFNSRFNLNDENSVDLKYQGPVTITSYYTSNKYE